MFLLLLVNLRVLLVVHVLSSNYDCLFFFSSVTVPFSQGGISIEETMSYIKVEVKLGLVFMWNQKDSLWVSFVCFVKTRVKQAIKYLNSVHFLSAFKKCHVKTLCQTG